MKKNTKELKALLKKSPFGVLQSCMDHSTVPVWLVKAKAPNGKVLDVWVDSEGKFVAHKGNEAPFWNLIIHNSVAVTQDDGAARLPIGLMSR